LFARLVQALLREIGDLHTIRLVVRLRGFAASKQEDGEE
jgi:hypothetical protein